MTEITMNKYILASLRRAYAEAVKNNQDQFEWMGNTLVVGYAKYLIQYAEQVLGVKPKKSSPSA